MPPRAAGDEIRTNRSREKQTGKLAALLTAPFVVPVRFAFVKSPFLALIIWATLTTVGRTAPFNEAEVTRTVNIVSLFSEIQAARPAAIGDVVTGRTALKTADESRAELRFPIHHTRRSMRYFDFFPVDGR